MPGLARAWPKFGPNLGWAQLGWGQFGPILGGPGSFWVILGSVALDFGPNWPKIGHFGVVPILFGAIFGEPAGYGGGFWPKSSGLHVEKFQLLIELTTWS